ncbi:MAG TPA: hypothetical protein EYP90_10985, partial [Chromatiaceae bacterium]|nr:hypothetical protein [Chromatiaceae bacterium]
MNPSCMATTHFAPPADAKLSSLLGQLIEALPLPGKLLGLCHKLEFEQHFPLTAHGYSRTILHRKKNGAEAMVARWDKGAATPIHGHPHLAFVYLLEGRLQIDNFDQHNGQLHLRETVVLEPGDHIWN